MLPLLLVAAVTEERVRLANGDVVLGFNSMESLETKENKYTTFVG